MRASAHTLQFYHDLTDHTTADATIWLDVSSVSSVLKWEKKKKKHQLPIAFEHNGSFLKMKV